MEIEIIDKQARNAVDDRVDPVTTDALKARGVETLPEGLPARRTAQDL